MEWVETTGRTVEEAKDAALDELGVDEADAEFEVMEEPRQGLFGRQRGEARVRARVRPTSPRPKADRRDRRRRRPEGGAGDANVRSTTPERDVVPATAAEAADSGDEGDAAKRRRRRRGGRGGSGDADAALVTPRPRGANGSRDEGGRSSVAEDNGGMSVPEEELSLAEQGELARQFVVGLLEKFGASAETSVATIDDETVEVQVSGAELGLLIGPKGQTLQALQELTRTAVQRRSVARTGRILVDVAGYRVRRREALERFTRQVADDVRASAVQRALEPMSAADRKVVHDTANDIEGVRTVSEGEEPHRRVVIVPDEPAAASAAAE